MKNNYMKKYNNYMKKYNKYMKKYNKYMEKYAKNLSEEDKEIFKLLNNQLDNMQDVFKSDTFKASIYLLKYLSDNDIKYYIMFQEMMAHFTINEKKQVISNVIANLIEQNKNKEKVKKI